MTHRWKIGVAACLGALVGGSVTALSTPDRVAVVPGTTVLLDNEHVRVQYHDVAPGETIPLHSHPATVVYSLAPYKAKLSLPDGTSRIAEGHAGEAFFSPPVTHTVENLGQTKIHNLVVELKHLPAP